MPLLVLIAVACLAGAGTYLMLRRRLLRVVLGLFLLNHAVNLLVVSMGGIEGGPAPLVREAVVGYADPLPQALVLTAIVINLGTSALLIAITSLAVRRRAADDLEPHGGGGRA